MPPRERRAVIIALLFCDGIVLLCASFSALALRYGAPGWPGGSEMTAGALTLLLLLPALTLALLVTGGMYHVDYLFSGHREYAGAVQACTYSAFAVLLVAFLLDTHVSRGALVLSWSYACLLLGIERFVFRRAVFRLRRSGRLVRLALIVGTDEHAIAIARRLSDPATGWRIVGFLDDYQPAGTPVLDGLGVVGDPAAAVELARAYGASDLILVPHAVSWETQRDLLEIAATCDEPALRLAPGLYHLLAAGARPLDANFVSLLSLERLRITGVDATLKTVIDYSLSVAALPALALLLGPLWLAARLTSSGPLLERRPSLGLRSKPFDLLMVAQPPAGEPRQGLRRWAWRLRKTAAQGRLAKLPNIWNVLTRRMSLIGPRALIQSFDGLRQPWPHTLLLVRPGITGPHVTSGGWSAEEQAIQDVAYVRDYSFWLDLRLLFLSLMRALRGHSSLPASYRLPTEEEPLPVEAAIR